MKNFMFDEIPKMLLYKNTKIWNLDYNMKFFIPLLRITLKCYTNSRCSVSCWKFTDHPLKSPFASNRARFGRKFGQIDPPLIKGNEIFHVVNFNHIVSFRNTLLWFKIYYMKIFISLMQIFAKSSFKDSLFDIFCYDVIGMDC